MKLDALGIAAVAVAGLAVYAYAKPKAVAAPAPGMASSTVTWADVAALEGNADAAYSQASAQRQESGAAKPVSLDYLGTWPGFNFSL